MQGACVASKGVGQVDGEDRSEALRRAGSRLVMEGDGFDDGRGQAPEPQEVGAKLGMSGAEGLLFKLNNIALISTGLAQQRAVYIRQTGCQD